MYRVPVQRGSTVYHRELFRFCLPDGLVMIIQTIDEVTDSSSSKNSKSNYDESNKYNSSLLELAY